VVESERWERSVSGTKPVPGYEDLFPHVSLLVDPGHDWDGGPICDLRAVAVMVAPSWDEFVREWQRQEPLIRNGLADRFHLPEEWQRGAKRRAKELMARYDTDLMFEVLRGLERDHGALSATLATPTQP
jgi:hypothetical protein